VRDKERLERAMHGIDVVVHAAALKQITSCEYNPFEAIQTNVIGVKNVIDAAIDQGVKRVMPSAPTRPSTPSISTAHQALRREAGGAGQRLRPRARTIFSVVRYGNVIGSRGSVIPLFEEQKRTGTGDGDGRRHDAVLDPPQRGRRVRRSLHRGHARRRDLRAEDSEHAHRGIS
jgi:UDP-N-acetylglucosamine 4,6-dehydratase